MTHTLIQQLFLCFEGVKSLRDWHFFSSFINKSHTLCSIFSRISAFFGGHCNWNTVRLIAKNTFGQIVPRSKNFNRWFYNYHLHINMLQLEISIITEKKRKIKFSTPFQLHLWNRAGETTNSVFSSSVHVLHAADFAGWSGPSQKQCRHSQFRSTRH